jgi:hypothetical protein
MVHAGVPRGANLALPDSRSRRLINAPHIIPTFNFGASARRSGLRLHVVQTIHKFMKGENSYA